MLFLAIGAILWTYRLTFSGEVYLDKFKVVAKCRLNVFNHKNVKVYFVSENQNVTIKRVGKTSVSTFRDDNIPYVAQVTQDKTDLRKFKLTLITKNYC